MFKQKRMFKNEEGPILLTKIIMEMDNFEKELARGDGKDDGKGKFSWTRITTVFATTTKMEIVKERKTPAKIKDKTSTTCR